MEIVKDLMVPVEGCASVQQEMTVRQAIEKLTSASVMKSAPGEQSRGRALLVMDKNDHIVGKLSRADIVLSMEQRYRGKEGSEKMAHTSAAGLSPALIQSMLRRLAIWGGSFEERCRMVLNSKVKDCMHILEREEYVQERDSLEVAIRHLALGPYQSLLVTGPGGIVGVLKLNDVFNHIARGCEQAVG